MRTILFLIIIITVTITANAQIKVLNNGNVGIGINTDPTYKLHLIGTSYLGGDATVNGNTTLTGNASITGNTNITGNTVIGGSTSLTGSLGVGITGTPNSKIDVNGNIQISNSSIPMGLMTEVTGTTNPILNLSINFREPNKTSTYLGGAFRIDTRNTSTMPLFQWIVKKAGGSEVTMMELNSSGQLGIGRHPSCALDVTGVIQMNGVAVTSDARLKENITGMKGSLASLANLRGVTYKLKPLKQANLLKTSVKTDSTNSVSVKLSGIDSVYYSRNHIGFLAQEIQAVYPELVYTNADGMLSVDYVSLIPVLVESVKELNSKQALDSITFKARLAEINNKRITDSIYFEARLKDLESRLSQCCGKTQLKNAPVNSSENLIPELYQNTPNPFTESTVISYYLPSTVNNATLYIYNMQGVQIKKISITTRGNDHITINGSELMAGMYLYSLIADGKEVDTKRMILTQ